MQGFSEVTLSNIADGAAIVKFDQELHRVIENCQDVNTDPEAVRTITLTVKIKPTQDRKSATITFQASSKIVGDAPGNELMHFGQNGAFVSTARQLKFEDYEQVSELDKAINDSAANQLKEKEND
jgi:hypothetical protein